MAATKKKKHADTKVMDLLYQNAYTHKKQHYYHYHLCTCKSIQIEDYDSVYFTVTSKRVARLQSKLIEMGLLIVWEYNSEFLRATTPVEIVERKKQKEMCKDPQYQLALCA